MVILAYILSGLSLLMSVLMFIREGPPPGGFFVLYAKLFANAFSPLWAIFGAVGAILGWFYQAIWAIPIGVVGAALMIWYVWRVSRNHNGFDAAFGADWSAQIKPEQAAQMLQRRWTGVKRMTPSPEPCWERDVAFTTVPGTDRHLLCDLWYPADGKASGLGLVFLHGSAWSIGDKDLLSRPFFRHLVAQGHTVMDVAYRLCPEVGIHDMVGDVKRAVDWMKINASRFGVDPDKVVLGGGSAGGHLALLAAYAPYHPELTPPDLQDADLSVCGVLSYYGPTDMLAEYERYMEKPFFSKYPAVPAGTAVDPQVVMQRYVGRLDMLLGGHPQDALQTYQVSSPISHVHPGCPPTLLLQGNTDLLVPAESVRALYAKLVEAGVPTVGVFFPATDHAFDLPFPQVSPVAQSALYDVDRFLALLLNQN